MEKEASSTPSELREISDDDDLVVSSICPRQTNRSIQPSGQSLKAWFGPVQVHSWTDLPKCMKFIAKNGCIGNRSHIWMRRTLDRLSPTTTPEQLIHILNGYADLHKLVLYFIQINDNVPINVNDIRTFRGTSSTIAQEKRHRNIAFIMYNSEDSLFTSLYTTHADGRPQTCFDTDDERIIDDISDLFRRWNDGITQRSAQEVDHTGDNNDATRNAEESQDTDSLDALLPTEFIARNGGVLTTAKIGDNGIQHTSPIIAQSDIHPSAEETVTNSNDSMAKNIHQNLDCIENLLDRARRLRGEIDDIPSVEPDDRRLASNMVLEERELMSHNGMINMTRNKSGHAEKHIRSSNNNRSHPPVRLSQGTTQPTSIPTLNHQIISRSVQLSEPPNVTKQPKRHRHVRMLKDLANKECPLVQAGERKQQRIYPEIEISGDVDGEIHIRVRAVTENRHPHPCTTVAPGNAFVDWKLMKNNNARICLRCTPDSFDSALECVYLPITPDERQKRRKIIKVYLFNWKQYGPTIKEVIERENLRLCRLEFYFCTRLNLGQYELVSQPSYTMVIEQVDGDVTIDPAKIEPKQLCELGGEKIIAPLSVICRKKDFSIECNGDELPKKEFTMERKKLLITSPPKVVGIDELHLIIKRIQYFDNSSIREEKELYNEHLPYVTHDQYIHSCSQPVATITNSEMS